MKARQHAALRLGAPLDTCKECEAVFACQELGDVEPLRFGVLPEERRRVYREMMYNGEPVRFLVREAAQPGANGVTRAVQFHGPFCSEECARTWMEPRQNATRYIRETRWTIYLGQWGGPLSGHSDVDVGVDSRKVRAGQVWLPLGPIGEI